MERRCGPLAKMVCSENDSEAFAMPSAAEKILDRAVRRELRQAKAMAAMALAVTLLSVVLLASYVPRFDGSTGASRSSLRGTVALDGIVSNQAPGLVGSSIGWHRAYMQSSVRREMKVDSEELQIVPVGSLVWVAETQGNRARVLRPVQGWMSMETEDGVLILRPDISFMGKAKSTDVDKVFHGREMLEASAKLQDASAKLTAAKRSLLDKMQSLKDHSLVKSVEQGSAQVGAVVTKIVPEANDKFARDATEVLKRAVTPQAVQDVLNTVGGLHLV